MSREFVYDVLFAMRSTPADFAVNRRRACLSSRSNKKAINLAGAVVEICSGPDPGISVFWQTVADVWHMSVGALTWHLGIIIRAALWYLKVWLLQSQTQWFRWLHQACQVHRDLSLLYLVLVGEDWPFLFLFCYVIFCCVWWENASDWIWGFDGISSNWNQWVAQSEGLLRAD